MTKDEIFEQQQQSMSDAELINLCKEELSKLCKTGGRSFKMTVPVRVKDTDMLFSELIRRFERCLVVPAEG